jgi:hypothetical protein
MTGEEADLQARLLGIQSEFSTAEGLSCVSFAGLIDG